MTASISTTAAFLPSSKLPLATNKILTGTAHTSSHMTGALHVSPHQSSFFDSAASSFSPITTTTTSSWIASTTSTTTGAQPQQFDAILPDPVILVGMSVVVVISIVAAIVWNTQVVPVSRTKLAISKAKGPVKEYLDELRVAAAVAAAAGATSSKSTTTTATTSIDDQYDETVTNNVDLMTTEVNNSNNNNNRSFERWLFADWLRPRSAPKKAPAIPESLLFGVSLKDAKWNSGDNPVLVTTAMMMVGVVVASIAEQFRGM